MLLKILTIYNESINETASSVRTYLIFSPAELHRLENHQIFKCFLGFCSHEAGAEAPFLLDSLFRL